MQTRKKRILIVGEASYLRSGFGLYSHELLTRLNATNKYELAEFATYGQVNDARDTTVKWKFYANAVKNNDPRYQQYNAHSINQFGLWRINRVLLDFKPDIVAAMRDPWMDSYIADVPLRPFFHWVWSPTVDSCFLQNTHIITAHGVKNIQDIKTDDLVLTHNGQYKKVIRTFKNLRNYKKILTITTTHCALPIHVTEDHSILSIPREKQKWKGKSRIHRSFNHTLDKASFIKAKNLKKDDYLIIPYATKVTNHTKLRLYKYLSQRNKDLGCHINHTLIPNGSKIIIPDIIDINDEFLTWCGWYIAEGSVSNLNNKYNPIMLSLNGETEQHHLDYLEQITYKIFGNNINIKRSKNKYDKSESLVFCNSILGYALVQLFGKDSYTKKIPKFIMELSPKRLIPFLKALITGDGCDTHTIHNKRIISYCTVSKELALQLFHLLLKIGCLSSLSVCTSNQCPTYHIQILNKHGQKIANLFNWNDSQYKFSKFDNSKAWIDYKNHCAIVPIKSITTNNTKDEYVYNFHVQDDQSYVTSFAVHNCPQNQSWIETYLNCDGVLTYSDWGYKVLEREGGGKIKLHRTASPGVDLKIFCPPTDIKTHRNNMRLMTDVNLIGTVMRNQRRKLYPDLFIAFKRFLEICHEKKQPELAKKTYLYIHTSYPDVGWNIPELLKEHGLGCKVLFSYICRECKQPFCAFFQDARTVCPHCNAVAGVLPSVSEGVTREQLADVYKLFDIYVQYAICLGKDEEILLKRGWTPISQVKIGDYAWTHKGRWKKVLNVYKNLKISQNEQVKKIKIHGDYEELIATANHKFYSITNDDLCQKQYRNICYKSRSVRENIKQLHKRSFSILGSSALIPNWISTPKPLEDLRPKDFLCFTIDDNIEDINTLDLIKYQTPNSIIYKKSIKIQQHKYPRYIKVDNDFCKLLGLYVADGSSELYHGMIKITCHNDEINIHNFVQKQFMILGNKLLKIRKYKNRNAIDLYLCSTIHQKAFLDLCKKHEQKQFPKWVLNLPLEKQKQILIGLFLGDGCYYKPRNISVFNTISKTLAEQLKYILRRLRLNYNCHKNLRLKDNLRDNKNRKPIYRFEIYGNIQNGEFDQTRHNTRNYYINNYHLLQIKSIENIDYDDDTYNLEVKDDHSMTTKLGCTPQCEGFGIPLVEAAACGIPIMAVDYSAMEDVIHNVKGIPLKVQRMFREADTNADRAMPDNEYLAQQLFKFFNRSPENIIEYRRKTRIATEQHYNWDQNAKIWENYFDSVELTKLQGRWDYPYRKINTPPNKIPDGLNNVEFMEWLVNDVWQQPEKLDGYTVMAMLRDLNHGATQSGNKLQPLNRDHLFKSILNRVHNFIECEKGRCGLIPLSNDDYIEYAKIKERLAKENNGSNSLL